LRISSEAPSYAHATISPGMLITALDILELRAVVNSAP
jgi:hypothetical protein